MKIKWSTSDYRIAEDRIPTMSDWRRVNWFAATRAGKAIGNTLIGGATLIVMGATGLRAQPCEQDPALYVDFQTACGGCGTTWTLSSNVTWTGVDLNVNASVVVPAGRTLTIDGGSVVNFADSRVLLYTVNLVVQPGGLLVLNNCKLTDIEECAGGMWDGIKALGNGSGVSSTANGEVRIVAGSSTEIANAYTGIFNADGDPVNPLSGNPGSRGMRIRCESGFFHNNVYDVVLRALTAANAATPMPSTRFFNVIFQTDAVLNEPTQTPQVHLFSDQHSRLNIKGCQFNGAATVAGNSNLAAWGRGIEAYHTDIRIGTSPAPASQDPSFTGLSYGCNAANSPLLRGDVLNATFTNCGFGLTFKGNVNTRVEDCVFEVLDLNTLGQLGGSAYGSFLDATPVILAFERNTFTAVANDDYACVGSVFFETGATSNFYNDNSYDGFDCANCTSMESAGVIIQGENSGLQFICNSHSSTALNAYDMAFTGGAVTKVASIQGTTTDPAGNIFADPCGGEQNMHVNSGTTVAAFTYNHHQPAPGIVPSCVTVGLPIALFNTNVLYMGCAGPAFMMMSNPGEQTATVANAAAEYAILKTVYDDWTDGGDTEGLKDFVSDPANVSYAIRNQLMLVAPKVSSEVWQLVFDRIGDMNAWHLAQALLANSPLEPTVLQLMENSDLTPYYKQLVANDQEGSSMHSIYKSDLAYWQSVQTQALKAYTTSAYADEPAVSYAEALALHEQYPVTGSAECMVGLRLANDDMAGVRDLVNSMLATEHNSWWDVQDLWLAQLEASVEPEYLGAQEHAQLQAISDAGGIGAGSAKAWLNTLGTPTQTLIELPTESRSLQAAMHGSRAAMVLPILNVLPNPATSEAYVSFDLSEGHERMTLALYDATGREFWRKEVSGTTGLVAIPANDLLPGLYQIRLSTDGYALGAIKLIVAR